MKCTHRGGGVWISEPDATDQWITVADCGSARTWRFDFDERFGPLWLHRGRGNDAPLKNQNPPAAVWTAFKQWHTDYLAQKERTSSPQEG